MRQLSYKRFKCVTNCRNDLFTKARSHKVASSTQGKCHALKRFKTLWFLLLLLCLCGGSRTLRAQEVAQEKKNFIALEGFGPGAYYSINYGRQIFSKPAYRVFTKIGLSSYHLRDYTNSFNPDFIIPIGLQIQYGKEHQLVAGLGNTISSIVQLSSRNFKPERQWQHHGYILLGYQYSKRGSPYFFGLAYSPLLERYEEFRHWGAVSLGLYF